MNLIDVFTAPGDHCFVILEFRLRESVGWAERPGSYGCDQLTCPSSPRVESSRQVDHTRGHRRIPSRERELLNVLTAWFFWCSGGSLVRTLH